jgi:hypothetical protein
MTILGKFVRRQGRESVVKGRSLSKFTSIKRGILQRRRRLHKVPWRKTRQPNAFEMHLRENDRPEVGKETLLAMESQVMDLLRPSPLRSPECSVPAMASALAGSIQVMDTHANTNYNDNNDDGGRSKDAMFSITRHLTNLRFLTGGAQKESLARRYELITALNNLEKDPATMNTKVNSWLEARDILATVLKLPVDAQSEATAIVPAHTVFAGRELVITPMLLVEEKDEVDKFFLRLEEKTRKAREEELKPSSTKWKQIVHHPTPPPLGLESSVVGEGHYLVSSLERADKEFEFTLQRHTDSYEARIKSQAVAEVEERLKEEEARKLASSLMRSLTSDENAIVRNAMYGIGPDHEILAQVGSDSVQRGSIHRLQPGQWLNDEVIHYFYVMLAARDEELCHNDSSRKRSHFFKSFFMTKLLNEGNTNVALDGKYDYRNVKRWSKNAPGKDIFKLDKIFFPINEGRMHWICAVAFVQERRIQMYDSMGSDGMHYLQSIFQYIKDEHQDKKKAPLPDVNDWELVPCTRETPRQRNGEK